MLTATIQSTEQMQIEVLYENPEIGIAVRKVLDLSAIEPLTQIAIEDEIRRVGVQYSTAAQAARDLKESVLIDLVGDTVVVA